MTTPHDHAHDDHGSHAGGAELANRVKGLIATLERRGVLTEAAIDTYIEGYLTSARPANGFRVVARAWVDPKFRQRLLADATETLKELDIDITRGTPVRLRAVENVPERHNVIVCTLCSCYPMNLLGTSPAWYKSEAYRSRVVRDPRGVLAEFGVDLAPEVEIRVWDSTSELRYMVVPQRPAGTDGASEAELATLLTRNGLIGTALV